MLAAIVITIVLVVLVGGTVLTLRTSARTGMPEKDVLERAARRARQLEAEERDGDRCD